LGLRKGRATLKGAWLGTGCRPREGPNWLPPVGRGAPQADSGQNGVVEDLA